MVRSWVPASNEVRLVVPKLTHDEVCRLSLAAYDEIIAAGLGPGESHHVTFDGWESLEQSDREAVLEIVESLIDASQSRLAKLRGPEPWSTKKRTLRVGH